MAVSSARGLASRGHHVTLLAGAGPDDRIEGNLQMIGVKSAAGTTLTKREELSTLWNSKAREVLQNLFQSGYHLVHIHSGIQRLGPACYQAVAKSGVPVIYTHHDYAWICPMQGLFDYKMASVCEVTPGSVACLARNCVGAGNMDYKLYRFFRHFGTHRMSGLQKAHVTHLFVSNQSRDRLLPYLPKEAATRVVENPIEVEQESPAEIKPESGFVYVGRLTIEKNPISVAKICEARGWPATFVGDGPLKEKIAAINPRATMLGWIPRAEVQSVIRLSRALVMPSLWYETQGMVALEAWAAGVPTVVSSSYAIAEDVVENGNGFVYKTGDDKQLQAKMASLEDVRLARRMGKFAYERFWDRPPTLDRHLNELELVYEEVAKAA